MDVIKIWWALRTYFLVGEKMTANTRFAIWFHIHQIQMWSCSICRGIRVLLCPPCEQWKVSIDLAIRLNTLVKCSIHIAMKWYFVSGFTAIWSRQLNPDNPDNGRPITLKHGRVTSQSETQAPAQLMDKSRIYSKLASSLIRKHVTYLLSIPKVIPIVPVLPVKCIYSVRGRDYRQGLLPKTIDHGRNDRAVAQLVI